MIPKDQFKQNDLFLGGDGHQNLYGHHIVLSQLGIDIRGRGRRLKINYRTPEETRKWAASILDGTKTSDLDGELDSTKGYVSLMTGPDPKLFSAKTFEEEVGCIASWVKEIKEADATKVICITAQSKQELESLAKALPKHGVVDLLAITSDNHDKDDPAPIRLITHHRIKGLEFDHVCISGCSKQKWNSLSEDRQLSARYLLHVAATRTKNSLLVTAIGSAYSPFENQ
jgi:superfamily I DNA/RNA helicase